MVSTISFSLATNEKKGFELKEPHCSSVKHTKKDEYTNSQQLSKDRGTDKEIEKFLIHHLLFDEIKKKGCQDVFRKMFASKFDVNIAKYFSDASINRYGKNTIACIVLKRMLNFKLSVSSIIQTDKIQAMKTIEDYSISLRKLSDLDVQCQIIENLELVYSQISSLIENLVSKVNATVGENVGYPIYRVGDLPVFEKPEEIQRLVSSASQFKFDDSQIDNTIINIGEDNHEMSENIPNSQEKNSTFPGGYL